MTGEGAIANRFDISTPYGFFMRPAWRNHLLVVREDSGLGTLTHQMMYHYLACSYPEGLPLWARQGAATFVEKFLALENSDRLDFSWGYRSNWRDPYVRKIISGVNLADTLRVGKEQWKKWLLEKAIDLPKVESSFMVWGKKADRVEAYLNYYWLWNQEKKIWMRSPKHNQDYIIPSLERILQLDNK